MATDLQTFALAFCVVWLGLGGYLLWLHGRMRRLERIVQAESLRRLRP